MAVRCGSVRRDACRGPAFQRQAMPRAPSQGHLLFHVHTSFPDAALGAPVPRSARPCVASLSTAAHSDATLGAAAPRYASQGHLLLSATPGSALRPRVAPGIATRGHARHGFALPGGATQGVALLCLAMQSTVTLLFHVHHNAVLSSAGLRVAPLGAAAHRSASPGDALPSSAIQGHPPVFSIRAAQRALRLCGAVPSPARRSSALLRFARHRSALQGYVSQVAHRTRNAPRARHWHGVRRVRARGIALGAVSEVPQDPRSLWRPVMRQ